MKTSLKLLFSILLVSAVPVFAQQGSAKKNISVLYVGGSANWEKEAFKDDAERDKDVARRTASFVTMLNQYFTKVTQVTAQEYTQQLSEKYDVTIIDGTPKPIAERQMIKDSSGKVTKYVPPAYLTEDFTKPVLFIGETGEKLGRSIGLKLDWYCLCLDAYAHNFRKEHEIFKGPFPVKMTIETKPTPEDAFHYEYFLGKKTPATLPMWRVQTKGYVTDKNFRIGMVARPWGFEDSPDAEYISSGVCAKTLDAVALGRHGNFFHWGFAASPEYLTKESQAVLANAICYISRFDGKGVIARKYLDRRATREYLKERKYYSSKDAYNMSAALNRKFDSTMLAEKEKAESKKGKGGELTEAEKRSLGYEAQPKQTFSEFVKKYQKDLFEKFGTETEAYKKYFDENKDYFYSEDAMYVMTIDEDVKSLGIPYYDKRLLDKCISMLEKGQDVAKANRILDRYTLATFTKPADWRKWYEKYKGQMFFTETGGYYFMINTNDKNVEGNDYKKKKLKQAYDQVKAGETSHENAVSVAAGIVDKGDGKKDVVIRFKVHPGYHLYAFVSDKDPYVQTDVKIDLPAGYTKSGELKKPSFGYYNEAGTTIYANEVMFVQEISGKGNGEVVCAVTYQCCDDQICFPPVTGKEYRVVLPSI